MTRIATIYMPDLITDANLQMFMCPTNLHQKNEGQLKKEDNEIDVTDIYEDECFNNLTKPWRNQKNQYFNRPKITSNYDDVITMEVNPHEIDVTETLKLLNVFEQKEEINDYKDSLMRDMKSILDDIHSRFDNLEHIKISEKAMQNADDIITFLEKNKID